MSQIARSYKEGIRPPALDSAGGLQEGNIVVQTTPDSSGDPEVILPSGTAPYAQVPYGVNEVAGYVAGTGTKAGEALAVKRQGLARALLTNGNTVTAGQEMEADASVLGNVIARTPYGRSGWALGTFEEGYGPSSTNDLVEGYFQPVFKELVRQVTAGATTAPGAATKYGTAPGQAGAAAAIPLYRARFAGETVRNLSIAASTAPGGTDTLIATIQKSSDNGATWTSLAVTATITGTGKSAADLTHTAVLAAGDMLALQLVSSNVTVAGITATFDVT